MIRIDDSHHININIRLWICVWARECSNICKALAHGFGYCWRFFTLMRCQAFGFPIATRIKFKFMSNFFLLLPPVCCFILFNRNPLLDLQTFSSHKIVYLRVSVYITKHYSNMYARFIRTHIHTYNLSDMMRMSKCVYGIQIDMMVMIERYAHSINKHFILHLSLISNSSAPVRKRRNAEPTTIKRIAAFVFSHKGRLFDSML